MSDGTISVMIDARELQAAHGEETTKYAGSVKLRVDDGAWVEYHCPEWETDRTAGWADWISEQIRLKLDEDLDDDVYDAAFTASDIPETCDGELTEWLVEWTRPDEDDLGDDVIVFAQVFDVMRAAQETVDRCVKDLKAIIERSYAPGEYVDTESMLRIGKAITQLDQVVLWDSGEDEDGPMTEGSATIIRDEVVRVLKADLDEGGGVLSPDEVAKRLSIDKDWMIEALNFSGPGLPPELDGRIQWDDHSSMYFLSDDEEDAEGDDPTDGE